MTREEEFKQTIRRPDYAWPTIGLFIVASAVFVSTFYLGSIGQLPVFLAIPINAIAAFWLFTTFHDASHNAVSKHAWLNDGIGRIAILGISPLPIFRAFRFIHMQHHRFTNEGQDRDPDAWCGGGRKWTLVFRWATLDCYYYAFYLPKLLQRPKNEARETVLMILLSLGVLAVLVYQGYGYELLFFWLVPSRIAIIMLALAFDFLPHYPHAVKESEDPYKATSNRLGWEWLLTPVLLYQNYHLVHHLYPRAPFYRYIKIWRTKLDYHLEHEPYLISVTGKLLS